MIRKRFSKPMGPKKKDGVAILMSNKRDFKPKLIKREGKDTPYSSKEQSTKTTSQFSTSMPKHKGTKVCKENTSKA